MSRAIHNIKLFEEIHGVKYDAYDPADLKRIIDSAVRDGIISAPKGGYVGIEDDLMKIYEYYCSKGDDYHKAEERAVAEYNAKVQEYNSLVDKIYSDNTDLKKLKQLEEESRKVATTSSKHTEEIANYERLLDLVNEFDALIEDETKEAELHREKIREKAKAEAGTMVRFHEEEELASKAKEKELFTKLQAVRESAATLAIEDFYQERLLGSRSLEHEEEEITE